MPRLRPRKLTQRAGKTCYIRRANKNTRVTYHFAEGCKVASDHGTAARHSFEDRQTKSFVERGLNQGMGGLIKGDHFIGLNWAQPDHTICNSQSICQFKKAAPCILPLEEDQPP